jgi:hypothetical protein
MVEQTLTSWLWTGGKKRKGRKEGGREGGRERENKSEL